MTRGQAAPFGGVQFVRRSGQTELGVDFRCAPGHERPKQDGQQPAHLRQIVQDLVQARGLRNVKGTGLGLYIVDQIARAHGGGVAAEARGGRTVFTVRLPRRAGES